MMSRFTSTTVIPSAITSCTSSKSIPVTSALLEEQKQLVESNTVNVKQVEKDLRRVFDGLGSPGTHEVLSNDQDRVVASNLHASLMFGEILFNGVSRIMDESHMKAAKAKTLYDLGSGCGRLVVQVFLQFPNLEKVVGVELTSVRSKVGFTAVSRLAKNPPKEFEGRCKLVISDKPYTKYSFVVQQPGAHHPTRSLELRQMNLFDCQDAWESDILIAETNIDQSMRYDFLHFLSNCKPGCRLLTYNDLELMHKDICFAVTEANSAQEQKSGNETRYTKPAFPWKRLAINTIDDRFEASWGTVRFHLFERIETTTTTTTTARSRILSATTSPSSSVGSSHSSSNVGFTSPSFGSPESDDSDF